MSNPSSPRKQKRHNINNNVVGPSTTTWDDHLPVPKLTFTSAAAVVCALALLCFANSHDAAFVFDDSEAIVKNDDLRLKTPLHKLFTHDFWGSRLASNTSHKSYRPLTVLTFRWNYALAGGLYPWGFHVVNIALHAVVSVIFLQVFSVCFSGQLLDQQGHVTFRVPRASLLAGMLFATHPIHTESVAGVVGRADLMCALTMLLSFLSYIRACHTGQDYSSRRPREITYSWLLLGMLLAATSVLFKEQGITILGICSAYDVLIQCHIDLLQMAGLRPVLPPSPPPRSPHRSKAQQNGVPPSQFEGPWVRPLAVRHLVLMVTGVLILAGRLWVMGSSPPTFQVVDNPHSFVDSFLFRVLNYNYLYALNMWLLVNPWWLCFDWSMGCVPVIQTLLDPRLLPVLLFWLALGTIVYVCLARHPCREVRVTSMGVAILVVPFLPASNLFFRVGFVIAERILYVSVAGVCMLVTLGATLISRQPSYRQAVRITLVLIVTLFTARSMLRSAEWKTEKSLFEAGVRVCPNNAKVHYNIAKINADSGNSDLAVKEYEVAIRLNPEYDQAMNNLGNIMKEQGRLVEAEQLLEKATVIRPDFAAALMNLAIVQAALNKSQLAENNYMKALSHRRKYPDCYYNLGNLYLDLGRHREALTAWRNATLQKADHVSAWSNMLILLDQLGRLDEMEIAATEAFLHLPQEAVLHYNMGNAYGKAARYSEGENSFLQALRLEPSNAMYHANLGVLYHRWGKLFKAEAAYKEALKLDPHSRTTRENLDMLQRRLVKDAEQ